MAVTDSEDAAVPRLLFAATRAIILGRCCYCLYCDVDAACEVVGTQKETIATLVSVARRIVYTSLQPSAMHMRDLARL